MCSIFSDKNFWVLTLIIWDYATTFGDQCFGKLYRVSSLRTMVTFVVWFVIGSIVLLGSFFHRLAHLLIIPLLLHGLLFRDIHKVFILFPSLFFSVFSGCGCGYGKGIIGWQCSVLFSLWIGIAGWFASFMFGLSWFLY